MGFRDMPGEIDQFSAELGRLRAQAEEAERQRGAQFRKLDTISDQVAKVAGQIELIASQIASVKKELEDDIKPAVQDFKSLKSKGLGVIGVVALLGSGAGAIIQKAASFLQS
jgi:chromosome segregation ATPase